MYFVEKAHLDLEIRVERSLNKQFEEFFNSFKYLLG